MAYSANCLQSSADNPLRKPTPMDNRQRLQYGRVILFDALDVARRFRSGRTRTWSESTSFRRGDRTGNRYETTTWLTSETIDSVESAAWWTRALILERQSPGESTQEEGTS